MTNVKDRIFKQYGLDVDIIGTHEGNGESVTLVVWKQKIALSKFIGVCGSIKTQEGEEIISKFANEHTTNRTSSSAIKNIDAYMKYFGYCDNLVNMARNTVIISPSNEIVHVRCYNLYVINKHGSSLRYKNHL